MINKKKAIALSTIVIVILYSFSMFMSFYNNKVIITGRFNDEVSRINDEALNMFYLSYYEDDDEGLHSRLTENLIISNFSKGEIFPYAFYLYDDEGDLVNYAQPCIEFDDEYRLKTKYCYLGKYLTDDKVKELEDAFYDWLDGAGVYFSYKENENGEIIPVELYDDEHSLKFTDEEPESYVVPSYRLYLCLYNIIASDYKRQEYELIKSELDAVTSLSDFEMNIYNNYDDGVYKEIYDQILLNDGKEYTGILISRCNLNKATINETDFIQQAVIITSVFLVAYVCIILFIIHVFNTQKLKRSKYAFTNAAAHELKTPLAIIENQCEFIIEGVNEEKNNEYIKSIYSQTRHMSQLLNNLLRYNKLSTVDKIEKESICLNDIISTEIDKYTALAQAKDIEIKSNLNPTTVRCNRELISLVVDNFISNAIKFSQNSQTVEITLNNNVFSVKNSFAGKLSPDIWEMLYTDDTLSGNKSTGMGLPLSKEILNLHKFKYGYNNENGIVEFYFIAK